MTALKPIKKTDLKKVVLAKGAHKSIDEGACLMEMVSFLRGAPFSDRPACVSPCLGIYGRALNDLLPDGQRQKLIPLIPKLINTTGDGKDDRRAWIATDWLIRTYTPTFLRLVPDLVPYAESLESLHEVKDEAMLRLAMEKMTTAKEKSAAAGYAAGAAARNAAGAAAGDAAWYAARAAARAAAWAAAGAAAWYAGAAARDAAWYAAGAAARDAAWDLLQPTVTRLQKSAIKLFDKLIEATP